MPGAGALLGFAGTGQREIELVAGLQQQHTQLAQIAVAIAVPRFDQAVLDFVLLALRPNRGIDIVIVTNALQLWQVQVCR